MLLPNSIWTSILARSHSQCDNSWGCSREERPLGIGRCVWLQKWLNGKERQTWLEKEDEDRCLWTTNETTIQFVVCVLMMIIVMVWQRVLLSKQWMMWWAVGSRVESSWVGQWLFAETCKRVIMEINYKTSRFREMLRRDEEKNFNNCKRGSPGWNLLKEMLRSDGEEERIRGWWIILTEMLWIIYQSECRSHSSFVQDEGNQFE